MKNALSSFAAVCFASFKNTEISDDSALSAVCVIALKKASISQFKSYKYKNSTEFTFYYSVYDNSS